MWGFLTVFIIFWLNVSKNMPHCGSICGSKRLFQAKRAYKHAALRVDLRFEELIK